MILHRYDPLVDGVGRSAPRRHILPADVYRRGESYYVELDIPGVDLDDIDIEVERKHLTVTVERRNMVDEERTDISRGRPYGTFQRRFFLGDGLDGEGIKANYDQGVLTVEIPMSEVAKARKISISGSSNGELEA